MTKTGKNGTIKYTSDTGTLIKEARQNGLTDERIVITLTHGISIYSELRCCAEKYAPILGMSVAAFLKIARGYRR